MASSNSRKSLLNYATQQQPLEPFLPHGLIATRQPRQRKSRSKMDARLFNTQQAADYLNVSPWTVRRLAHDGAIHFIRRKYFYFTQADLDRYIRDSREREAL